MYRDRGFTKSLTYEQVEFGKVYFNIMLKISHVISTSFSFSLNFHNLKPLMIKVSSDKFKR